MQFLIYIMVYPIIWIVSRFPFRLLYACSSFFFFITYYLVGYRKKVVFKNLKIAFPEKTDKELKVLTKKNIQHFTDFIFESIKAFSISDRELHKRYKFKNLELIHELEKEGKGAILNGAHHCNWEWIIYIAQHTSFVPVGIYKKINNPYFEKVIRKTRERFGAILRRTTYTRVLMEEDVKKSRKCLYLFLSDQSPQLHKTKYWAPFFNTKVPVLTGAEELAKKYNLMLINFHVKRVKRGFYEVDFELVSKNPSEFLDYKLTDKYLNFVEKSIKKQPEFYLWTHNRFKHVDKYNEWLEMQKK